MTVTLTHALATIEQHRRGTGLQHTEHAALVWIANRRHTTPGDLAHLLGRSRPAITGLLDRLHTAGLITRNAVEHDRRVTRIDLTPRAIALLDPDDD